MAAAFRELIPWSGVDEKAPWGTGMVVPLGASNFVALENGKDLRVEADKSIIEIKELDWDKVDGWDRVAKRRLEWLELMSDAPEGLQYKQVINYESRVFEITGRSLGGFRGARLTAVDPRDRTKVAAQLRVVVLKKKPLKLAIRPVQVVRDPKNPKGGLIYHSKLLRDIGFDAKGLLDR
jgi:hypothetical protein